jgi:hypothetical protein
MDPNNPTPVPGQMTLDEGVQYLTYPIDPLSMRGRAPRDREST